MAINWDQTGSGLFSGGMKLFEADAQRRADEKRLAAARGPVYQGAQGATVGALGEASMDPQAAAAQQYTQQQGLVAPTRAKQTTDMLRMLRAKGLLGVANYEGAGEGPPGMNTGPQTWAQQPGVAANPHMAALFAGQSGADAKMAADAMAAAEARRTAAASRANTFSSIGAQQQATGLAPYAQGSGVSAAGKGMMPGMIKGIGGLVKDSGILSKIFGGGGNMFGSAGSNMVDPYGYGAGVGFGDLRQQNFSGGYY